MKWEQIHLKDGLKKLLSTYPIKNLETLYEIDECDNPHYENNDPRYMVYRILLFSCWIR